MSDPTSPPESLPPRLVRVVVAAVAITSGLNTLGAAFSPYLLLHSPLLLVALSPEVRHVVLVAGRVDLGLLIALATARRVLSMMATYGLGAVYGPVAVRWLERRYPRVGALIRWLERALARVGAPLLVLLPGYTVSALAGAARLPWRKVLAGSLVGQIWQMGMYALVGEAIMGWTEPILGWLKAHLWESTAVCVGAVLIQQGISWLRRRRAARRGASAAPEAEDELPPLG